MPEPRWERYPLLAQDQHAGSWLTIQANLGLAATTVDAYGRALEDYFAFSVRRNVASETATKADVAIYVNDLLDRPTRRRGPASD